MQTTDINGKKYYTIKQFAEIIGKTEQSVRNYIRLGNKIRRLDSIKVGYTILIPVEELVDYPFTSRGNNSDVVYHFDAMGEVV